MLKTVLASKIHRATVTAADINYEGSISIGPALMAAAGIVEFQQVYVWDVTNGNRLITYAITGTESSIQMNGAAARRINPGDVIIIATFEIDDKGDYAGPRLVYVDGNNVICEKSATPLATLKTVPLGPPAISTE
jgi:aspartate 1-decarboxylase